jgi:hypothetical protein
MCFASWPHKIALSSTALAAFSAPPFPVHSTNTEPEPVRILLMHESDLMLASAIEQDSITRNAIQAAVSVPIEFYSEGSTQIPLRHGLRNFDSGASILSAICFARTASKTVAKVKTDN